MLFNWIKHAHVKEAKLRLRRRCGYVCVSVSDKGQGFDPQQPGHAGGFGLLNIRERVKLLGGRVKVRSAKGKGSTFLIVVPDPRPQATRAKDLSVKQALHGSATQQRRETGSGVHVLRVLLADGHKIVREGIDSMLVGVPDREIVGQASNGRETVDLAYELEPDVVVMDISVPVMSGDGGHMPDQAAPAANRGHVTRFLFSVPPTESGFLSSNPPRAALRVNY